MHKKMGKVCSFLEFVIVSHYFISFLRLYLLTSKMEVTKCCNHNMQFCSMYRYKSLQRHESMEKSLYFLLILGMFLIFYVFLPLYVLVSEVAVVKSHHSISLKCSQYRDTGPTDPPLMLVTQQNVDACRHWTRPKYRIRNDIARYIEVNVHHFSVFFSLDIIEAHLFL